MSTLTYDGSTLTYEGSDLVYGDAPTLVDLSLLAVGPVLVTFAVGPLTGPSSPTGPRAVHPDVTQPRITRPDTATATHLRTGEPSTVVRPGDPPTVTRTASPPKIR